MSESQVDDDEVGSTSSSGSLCPICQSYLRDENALWRHQFRAHQSPHFPVDFFFGGRSSSSLCCLWLLLRPTLENLPTVKW